MPRIPLPRAAAAAAATALLAALPATAAAPLPTDAFLAEHLQPRHAAFAEAASGLEEAARAFCAAPGDLAPVRQAWHDAMDGWAGVQHVTYGPIDDFNRRFRLQFWPDPRGVLERELGELLRDRPTDILAERGLAFSSVAIQGLPMAERLLFGDGAETLTGADAEGSEAAYRCALLVAVAANVADIVGALDREWRTADDPWPTAFRDPAAADMVGDADDVASLALTGLTTQLQALRDQRVLPVLGTSAGEAAPEKAESALSARSLETIAASLAAMAEAYDVLFRPPLAAADPDLAGLMTRAFAQTLGTARGIPVPLTEAVTDPSHRPAVEQLATEMKALQQLLATRVADTLGLTLGFNALDGD